MDRRAAPLDGKAGRSDIQVERLTHPAAPREGGFTSAVCAVFFGYANFVVMGYFKDISADRATGYRTFPVTFGWRAAAICGIFSPASTCSSPLGSSRSRA